MSALQLHESLSTTNFDDPGFLFYFDDPGFRPDRDGFFLPAERQCSTLASSDASLTCAKRSKVGRAPRCQDPCPIAET